jgi:hypothetical protein
VCRSAGSSNVEEMTSASDVLLHVRDLLRPLVDQQHDEVDLGMVLRDGVGHLLEEDRLTGLRRRDDESALPLTDRGHQVHDPHRQVLVLRFEVDPLVRVAGAQVVEGDAVLGLVGIVAVDPLHLQQREVALALLRRAHLAQDRVTRSQVEPLDLARAYVDVVRAVQVVPVLRTQEAIALGRTSRTPSPRRTTSESRRFCSMRKMRSCLRRPE